MQLFYTKIVSPYDGLVVRRDRDPGGVVVPGGSLLQLINGRWAARLAPAHAACLIQVTTFLADAPSDPASEKDDEANQA